MKNLLAILGISLFLVGCFDESKKQEADSSQAPAEQKEARPEDSSSREKQPESTKDSTVSTEQNVDREVTKSGNDVKEEPSPAEKNRSMYAVHKKAFAMVLEGEKPVKVKQAAMKRKLAKRHHDVDGTYENGKLVSNFSPEELRVGAQVPMSQGEIRHLKMQCRYPFMSQQEVADNHCGTKTAIISY